MTYPPQSRFRSPAGHLLYARALESGGQHPESAGGIPRWRRLPRRRSRSALRAAPEAQGRSARHKKSRANSASSRASRPRTIAKRRSPGWTSPDACCEGLRAAGLLRRRPLDPGRGNLLGDAVDIAAARQDLRAGTPNTRRSGNKRFTRDTAARSVRESSSGMTIPPLAI